MLLKEVVLFAGLGVLLNRHVGRRGIELVLDHSPGLESCIATLLGGFEVPIGGLQVPIANFHIGDHVLQLSLEVGNGLVRANSRDEDWESVDEGAATTEQRLAGLDFEVRSPPAG